MTRGVRFTEDGARRIVAATRAFEAGDRDAPPIKFRDVGGDDGGELRIGKVASAWAIGTCATVTLWERTGTNCSPTASSPAETIESVANLSHDVPSGSWVVIGRATDGRWYLIEAAQETVAAVRIGKYTGSSTWAKHTTATIDIWENGTPPNETSSSQTIENVVNHWADVPANKWVGIQLGANGHYYLVVAEC